MATTDRTILDIIRDVNNEELDALKVVNEFSNAIPADYYLYCLQATPSITSAATLWDTVLNVDSGTGATAGHAITIYEGQRMFQTLIVTASTNTITLAAPIDYEFTSGATVETGIWNMAVDGSSTAQEFSIKSPNGAGIDVHTINVSMLDATDMDDGKFGGISQLTNGLIYRFNDGIKKNLALVVNNLGFWEIGFSTEYSAKAPAGQYGFKARRDIPNVNGVTLFMEKGGNTNFSVVIQDDLTDLDLMAMTINGHLVV